MLFSSRLLPNNSTKISPWSTGRELVSFEVITRSSSKTLCRSPMLIQ